MAQKKSTSQKRDRAARQAEERARQRQVEIARAQAAERQKRLKTVAVVGTLLMLAIAAVIAARVVTSQTSSAVTASLGPPAAGVPSPATGYFRRVGSVPRQGGKPELMFIGAQYCPFCAAERWAVIKALGQFGTFSQLQSSSSKPGEGGFSGVPTFDLLQAGYQSRYVAFDHKDLANRDKNPLQALSGSEQALFTRYDPQQTIPLVLVGGYAMNGSGYSPGDIDGKSFAAVQTALQQGSPQSFVTDINAEANLITAMLCRSDGQLPVSACGRPVVRQIEMHLQG